jgi:hypothetical protein
MRAPPHLERIINKHHVACLITRTNLHHFVESVSGLNAIDVINCFFWACGEIEFLSRPVRRFWRRKQSVLRCTAQASSTCAGILPIRSAIAEIIPCDCRVRSCGKTAAVTPEWNSSQTHVSDVRARRMAGILLVE